MPALQGCGRVFWQQSIVQETLVFIGKIVPHLSKDVLDYHDIKETCVPPPKMATGNTSDNRVDNSGHFSLISPF